MKPIARVKEVLPAACCSFGLALFVVALLLIAVFWPFGGGLAQTFVVDRMAGIEHSEGSPLAQFWRHWTSEARAETQLVGPTEPPSRGLPSTATRQPAATATPGIENAIYRVWILAGVSMERPAPEDPASERISI